MAGNRRATETFIISHIDEMTNNKENVEFYKKKFKSMTDAQFEEFINGLDNESIRLAIVEPNYSPKGFVSSEKLTEMCARLGRPILQHIIVEGREGMPGYKTPVKVPIYLVPTRRASQMLIKKVSVPPHTKVRDVLTGQVTGESKGATLSGPEGQFLGAIGANYTAIEKLKYTGGDVRGEAAYIAMLSRYGRANQAVLQQFSSGVKATQAVNTFLTAAMHRSNL